MKEKRERNRGIERERKKKVIILSDPRIKKFSNIKSLAKRGHDTGFTLKTLDSTCTLRRLQAGHDSGI